jgi:hypothetical protein
MAALLTGIEAIEHAIESGCEELFEAFPGSEPRTLTVEEALAIPVDELAGRVWILAF